VDVTLGDQDVPGIVLMGWPRLLEFGEMTILELPICIFLSTFAKLRKSTASIVMSVCLSVCMEKIVSHRMEFWKIEYLSFFFETMWRNIEFHYNRKIITGTLREDQYTFFIISG
jgi:hypothetical protein